MCILRENEYKPNVLDECLDKYDKTKIALEYGINLVVELPFQYATQSSDLFAKGAISTLKKLKKQIKDNGTIEDFEQGSQKFKRESPALKSYNQTMKTFDTFYKSFISLVPKETYTPPEDEFDEFNK